MLALMRKTFWSHFWSEKSNNNLVYCPSSPPFNDHAAATSVRGILNGPQNLAKMATAKPACEKYLNFALPDED